MILKTKQNYYLCSPLTQSSHWMPRTLELIIPFLLMQTLDFCEPPTPTPDHLQGPKNYLISSAHSP